MNAGPWLPRVVAVALPAIIVAASVVLLEQARTADDRREIANVGQVINGRVLDVGTAEYIDRRMKMHEPDVVILGNSLSRTNVLPHALAQQLGLPKQKVQLFSIPKSLGPHWYAVTRNRIYANGHRPKVIIYLSDLQSLLAVTPRSEASYLNLSAQLTDDEPLIDKKLGRSNYYAERIRQNRGAIRDLTLRTVRNASVNLLQHGRLSTKIQRRDHEALDRAFEDDKVDMALHHTVMPAFQTRIQVDPLFDPTLLPGPEDSFIPELTQLVGSHDGTALFVRPPMSPSMPDGVGDIVLRGVSERAQRLIQQHGGTYFDMRKLPMNDNHFFNPDHMNGEGAKRFTAALSDLIREASILRKAPDHRSPRNLEIETLAPFTTVDGQLQVADVAARYTLAPPEVPRSERAMFQNTTGARRLVYFDTHAYAGISDARTSEYAPVHARCSPLRITEDGQVLQRPHAGRDQVQKLRKGRMSHGEKRTFFSASDMSNPMENGRSYRLTLDAERWCEGALWLYPGDEVLIPLPLEPLADFDRGARIFRLNGHKMLGPRTDPGEVRFKLVVDGRPRIAGSWPIAAFNGVPHRWQISPLLGTKAKHAHVVITNPTDSFVLLTSVALREHRPQLHRQPPTPNPVAPPG